jgi:hypothetical protein
MTPEEKKEREAKILAMQCESTRKAMSEPERDSEWYLRPLRDWKAVSNAKSTEEAIGARSISFQEAKVYEGLRQNRGTIIAQMRAEPTPSSVTPAKKERAIGAFMFVRLKFTDLMKRFGMASDKEVEQLQGKAWQPAKKYEK